MVPVPLSNNRSPSGSAPSEMPLILMVGATSPSQAKLQQAIAVQGYRVIAVHTIHEALQQVSQQHPDLVLLEQALLNQPAYCAQLREQAGDRQLPILLLLQSERNSEIEQAIASGATDCITSPIHVPLLLRRISLLLHCQSLQQSHTRLERQVEQRLTELQEASLQFHQALDFEATLKRITDKVRDTLDENQVLQTAVQELTWALDLGCCNAALYNLEEGTSSVCQEYAASLSGYQGRLIRMENSPEIYRQLLNGQGFQFCSITPDGLRGQVAMYTCPILNKQEAIGDLWLVRSAEQWFDEQEMRLVQQVANQCAIGIRQARLYRTAQSQVEELEKLNHLKDDFVSTVSHELRSPLSNMRMAIQMLELTLQQAQSSCDTTTEANHHCAASQRYLKILRTECDRETSLINELLDLQRLELGHYPNHQDEINLSEWIAEIVQPFTERINTRQQTLKLELAPHFPPFITDALASRRILMELLNNACKYTPPGGTITLAAWLTDNVEVRFPDQNVAHSPQTGTLTEEATLVEQSAESAPLSAASAIVIRVSNSGIEIPADELPRIFDKFYRVPSGDPWKQGGTGLGLALVKRLIVHLDGSIQVSSQAGLTCFTILLPLKTTQTSL